MEPVFGQIKECRHFRRFSLRGLENVQAEWTLVCLTHNLLKLYRSRSLSGIAPSKQESTTYEPSLVCKLLILGCRLLIPDRLLDGSIQMSAA